MPSRIIASGWNTRSATPSPTSKSSVRRESPASGAAAASPSPSLRPAGPLVVSVETIEHGPFKESFLEIRRRQGKEIQIVTAIEVLSPSNKMVGNPVAKSFWRSSGSPRQPDSPGRDRLAPRRDAHLGRSRGTSSWRRPARSIIWSRSIASTGPRTFLSIRSLYPAAPRDRHSVPAGRSRRTARPSGGLRPGL